MDSNRLSFSVALSLMTIVESLLTGTCCCFYFSSTLLTCCVSPFCLFFFSRFSSYLETLLDVTDGFMKLLSFSSASSSSSLSSSQALDPPPPSRNRGQDPQRWHRLLMPIFFGFAYCFVFVHSFYLLLSLLSSFSLDSDCMLCPSSVSRILPFLWPLFLLSVSVIVLP